MRAIVFRIDSPGGSALASDLIWRALRKARAKGKPVVASFSDVAASGGYYVAAGADKVVAQPGTITGSIGVFVIRPMIAGALEKLGIGSTALTRGRYADLLLSTRPLSPEARERMRDEVRGIYRQFVERVAEGRGLDPEKVNEVGRGRVWTGADAKKVGARRHAGRPARGGARGEGAGGPGPGRRRGAGALPAAEAPRGAGARGRRGLRRAAQRGLRGGAAAAAARARPSPRCAPCPRACPC